MIRVIFVLVFNLLIYAPDLASASAPKAQAFGELPLAYDAAISPSGHKLAVIVNLKESYAIAVQNFGDSKTMASPWLLPLGSDIKPGFVKWINEDVFVASIRKSESYRGTPFTKSYLFKADVKTRKGDLLVNPKKIFRQFNDRVVDWLEDDPNHILMAYSDKQFYSYPDVKKVNVYTGADETIKRGVNAVETWVTDNDGKPRIGFGKTDKAVKKMIIFDEAANRWENVSEYPGLTVDTEIFAMANQGQNVVIGDYQGKDTIGLYLYSLKQKRIVKTIYHNDVYDVSGVILSKDGQSVIGAKYTADTDKIEILGEYGTLISSLRSKYSDFNVDYIDQTSNGDVVIIKMSSPYDPGGLFAYRRGESAPTKISNMYSQLHPQDMGDVLTAQYTARDGLKIPAFITLPPTVKGPAKMKNLPFIVLPHGGPYARDEKRFDYFAQFFATRGYGVLQMNFRGSEGYGKAFADAGRNNWIKMQEDVEDGTRWLYKKGYADPSKTCIAGWSYGGCAALMGAAKHSDLYQCAIAMAALTDIDEAMQDFKKYKGGKAVAKTFFGEAMKDRVTRRDNSPTKIAGQIRIPVLLAHGDKDQNVHYDQFIKMKKAMKGAGVNGTYLSYKNEDHYLANQSNRVAFFKSVERFLLMANGISPHMAR